jgi:hypothetical protein
MKRLAFDDPGAFRRRWSHLSAAALRTEALRDPLLFAADHLPLEDRREGAVIVVAELTDTPNPVIIVIPDGPAAPEEETCLGLLAHVIAQLDAAVDEADPYEPYDAYSEDPDFRDGDSHAVRRMGVVPHRLGSPMIHDIDRRWIRALGLISLALGIDSLGVLTRTRSGHLVRIPESAAA